MKSSVVDSFANPVVSRSSLIPVRGVKDLTNRATGVLVSEVRQSLCSYRHKSFWSQLETKEIKMGVFSLTSFLNEDSWRWVLCSQFVLSHLSGCAPLGDGVYEWAWISLLPHGKLFWLRTNWPLAWHGSVGTFLVLVSKLKPLVRDQALTDLSLQLVSKHLFRLLFKI